MKKLLFILALMFVITSIATGQVDRNLYLNSDATYGTLGLSSADTISNNDSIYIVKIAAKHNERATQSVKITLDSVSGSPYISAQLRGWLFENDTPTNIGSAIVWYGTSADTTFTITSDVVSKYRFHDVYFDANSTAQKAKVTLFEAKLYLE